MWKIMSVPFKLVRRSEFSSVFKFELVTQKWKNKSLAFELVARSEIFYFSISSQ